MYHAAANFMGVLFWQHSAVGQPVVLELTSAPSRVASRPFPVLDRLLCAGENPSSAGKENSCGVTEYSCSLVRSGGAARVRRPSARVLSRRTFPVILRRLKFTFGLLFLHLATLQRIS